MKKASYSLKVYLPIILFALISALSSVADTIIVDNVSATYTGSWTLGTSAADKYGGDYRFASTVLGGATATATYQPNIVTAGKYDVYIWYPAGANRSANAQWTVSYSGGSVTVGVNQSINGGDWRLIASAKDFAVGTTGFVRVSNDTGSSGTIVVADGVRLVTSPIPAITTQPQSQGVIAGVSASFSVTASGAGLVYQWRKNGVNLIDGGNVTGSTSATLVLAGVSLGDEGSYTVVVSNTAGSTTSTAATLAVVVPPSIATQPTSQTANANSVVSFSVLANGNGLVYQWRKNGVNLTDAGTISGSTTANLMLTGVTQSDAASYTVFISNAAGNVTSSAATLTVIDRPAITTQPPNRTVNLGANATFGVSATGSGLIYQWRKNGINLTDNAHITGSATPTLTVSAATLNDEGAYTVLIANAAGSVTSMKALLSVHASLAFSDGFELGSLSSWTTAPGSSSLSISTTLINPQSGSDSAYLNTSLAKMYHNFGSELVGHVRTTFWIFDNYDTQTRVFGDIRGYGGAGYADGNVQQVFGVGIYNVVFEPGTGTLANEYMQDYTYKGRVLSGLNAGWFNLNAPGAPFRSIGWHKFEIERLADGTTINFYVDGILGRSITDASNVGLDSVAIGSAGSGTGVTGNGWFDDVSVEYFDPPVIVTPPPDQSVIQGADATFTVVAAGNMLTYQWQRNSTDIPGATSSSLTLHNVQPADEGTYAVTVKNSNSPVGVSADTHLKVNIPPTFTLLPTGYSVCAGESVTFLASASGTGPLSYQWQKDGNNIAGATDSSYTRFNVSHFPTIDIGNYTVVVSSPYGSITSPNASLSVGAPPVIPFQPKSQTALLGSTVTFSVNNVDKGPFLYQWKKNGVNLIDGGNISGANFQTLTLSGVAPTDAGNYSVDVRSTLSPQCDAVSSVTATLTVITPVISVKVANDAAKPNVPGNFVISRTGPRSSPVTVNFSLSGTAAAPTDYAAIGTTVTIPAGESSAYVSIVPNSLSRVGRTVTLQLSADSHYALDQSYRSATLTINGTGSCQLVNGSFENGLTGWTYDPSSTTLIGNLTTDGTHAVSLAQDNLATVRILSQSFCVTPGANYQVSFDVTATPGAEEPVVHLTANVTDAANNLLGTPWQGIIPADSVYRRKYLQFQAPSTPGNVKLSFKLSYGDDAFLNLDHIVVEEIPCLFPEITTQPISQTSCAGNSVTFTVQAASSASPSYQWQFNGVDISGATDSSYTFNSSVQNAGDYDVVVSSTCSSTMSQISTTSEIATLTVAPRPQITAQPQSQIKDFGESVTFSVSVNGTPTGYQWFQDGIRIVGANSATYTIPAVALYDAGSYTVALTMPCGAIFSDSAVLTVTPPPQLRRVLYYGNTANNGFAENVPGIAPIGLGSEVWSGDKWLKATTAEFAAFDAIVFEEGDNSIFLTKYWEAIQNRDVWGAAVNGNVIIIGSDPDNHDGDDLIKPAMMFAAGEPNHTGLYVVFGHSYATEDCTTSTDNLKPADLLLGIGDFYVMGASQLSGGQIAGLNDVAIEATHPALNSITTAYLSGWGYSVHEGFSSWPISFAPFAIGKDGVTSGILTPDYTSGNAERGVAYILVRGSKVNVNGLLLSTTVASPCLGDSLPITARLLDSSGNPISGKLIRFKVRAGVVNEGPIDNCNPPSANGGAAGTGRTDANGEAFWNYTPLYAGVDTIEAYVDEAETGIQDPAYTSTIANVRIGPPVILKQPAQNQLVCTDGTVTFAVDCAGALPLSYQWKLNGTSIPGATGVTYKIDKAHHSDAGTYTVLVSNPCGSAVSDPALLSVNGPDIIAQPQSQTAAFNAPVTFSVTATGSGSLSYQWFFNGNMIGGANDPVFTISSVQPIDLGVYTVKVTDADCTLESAAATLTLTPLSGLVAWWAGEDNAEDRTGKHNGFGFDSPFMRFADPAFDFGVVGKAFTIDWDTAPFPSKPVILVPDDNELKLTQSLTVEGWVDVEPLPYPACILARNDNAHVPYMLSLQPTLGSDSITVRFHIESYYGTADLIGLIPASGWTHLAATLDDATGEPRLYANGAPIATTLYENGLLGGTTTYFRPLADLSPDLNPWISIGALNNGNMPYVGRIDEISLYSRALSADEIQSIYNYGPSGKPVIAPSVLLPEIVQGPASQTVYQGDPAMFNVTTRGTGLSYRWYYNGVEIPQNNWLFSSSSFLYLSSPVAGTFSVKVFNANGFVMSAEATLDVLHRQLPAVAFDPPGSATLPVDVTLSVPNYPNAEIFISEDGVNYISLNSIGSPINFGYATTLWAYAVQSGYDDSTVTTATFAQAPSITTQPQSQTVYEGGAVTFTVEAAGSDPLHYHWHFYGGDIGTDSPTLTLPTVSSLDAGDYSVRVENGGGFIDSSVATLSVNPPPAPTITTQPISQTIPTGSAVTFSVVATSLVPVTYQWHFNGGNIGANSSSLTIPAVQFADVGDYSVTVVNAGGSVDSAPATLTVSAMVPSGLVSWWPGNGNMSDIIGGNNGTMIGSLTYGAGQVGQAFHFNGNSSAVHIGNPAKLQLQNFTIDAWIQRDDASVVSQNPGGAELFGYGLGGYALGILDDGHVVLTAIGNNSVYADFLITDTVLHHLAVTKNGNFVVFYLDGQPYPAEARLEGTFQFTTQAAIGAQEGGTLHYSFLGLIDELDVFDHALSDSEVQSIYTAGAVGKAVIARPVIVTQPVSQNVMPGANVTFSVVAAGLDPLTYQWRFNGVNISGAASSSLTLNAVQRPRAGVYSVQVGNAGWYVTSADATLTVLGPVITQQPAGHAVAVGANATLSVSATGTGTLHYQWRKDGLPLPLQQSASMVISSAQVIDAGVYDVLVRDDVATATSYPAVLTVAPHSSDIRANPDVFSVQQGSSGELDVLANDVSAQELEIIGATSGRVTINSGLSLTYTPMSGFYGPDNFSYTIRNTQGETAQGSVTVFVNKVDAVTQLANNSPSAQDISVTLPAGTHTMTLDLLALSQAFDRDGDALSIYSVETPQMGLVTGSGSGVVTYSRSSSQFGPDTFKFVITDGNGGYATVNVSINQADTDGDGMPDEWENLFGTNPTVNDANEDPDKDGISNLIEYKLGTNPLLADSPLTLTQVITGEEPEVVTFKVPINYDSLKSVGNLRLSLDGGPGPQFQSFKEDFTDGKSLLTWNTTYDPQGQHFLHAQLCLTAVDYGAATQPIKVTDGPVLSLETDNGLQFNSFYSDFDDSGARLYAVAERGTTYSIEIRGADGTHVNTKTGTVPLDTAEPAEINEFWDLKGDDANQTPYAGNSFTAEFTVTPPAAPQARATKIRPLNLNSTKTRSQQLVKSLGDLNNGDFTVAYGYGQAGRNFGGRGTALNRCIQEGVVDPLMAAATAGYYSPPFPYKSRFNRPRTSASPWAGYLANQNDARNLIANLKLTGWYDDGYWDTRNFYWYGHGETTCFLNGLTGPSGVKIECKDVAKQLGNDQIPPSHPYRFVFLDCCNAGINTDWATAFGIPPVITYKNLVDNQSKARAFLGWKGEVFSIGADNGFVEYENTISFFFVLWQSGFPLDECVEACSYKGSPGYPYDPFMLEDIQYPLGAPQNWLARGGDKPGKYKQIYGYKRIKRIGFAP